MALQNLTSETIIFEDGTELQTSGFVAEVTMVEEDYVVNNGVEDITLTKRYPTLTPTQITDIETQLGTDFGIVDRNVVKAQKGTDLEGQVGQLVTSPKVIQVAKKDNFII